MKKIILSFCFIIFACLLAGAKTNKQFVIVIQAGHGATDAGAKSMDGTTEKDLALAYAKELQKIAAENNFKVVMCREDDTHFDLAERAALVNQHDADLFISIHFNENMTDASKRGFECFVGTQSNLMENRVLGKFMGAELHSVTGIKFNGVNTQVMTSLNAVPSPVALLNLGYMSNEKDLAIITSAAGKKEICQKILNAIVRYKTHFETAK